jgi:RND family efflux transporter MFP subunit
MGMDYIPVYEEDASPARGEGGAAVTISPEKIQKIGVKTEIAARRTLKRVIRTVGRVEPVEDRIRVVSSKAGGWVERLYADRTDMAVGRGDRLLEIFSPDIVSAEEEYLLALKAEREMSVSPYPDVADAAASIVRAALRRLELLDVSADQVAALRESGVAGRTMTMRSPAGGIVAEKMVVEGQRIEAGEPLFKIIDHSSVWVYGEIYENEAPYVKTGQEAIITPPYPGADPYAGRVAHIYSHLGSIRFMAGEGTEARTIKVRFELPNPGHALKLGMYLDIELAVDVAKDAVAVPEAAVINTGTRSVVVVDRGEGRFEPRDVRVGGRADGYFQIVSGVRAGERVVTSGNFLIDSEASLGAALDGMKGP